MKHLSCEAQKKAIIKLMASSSSFSEWRRNAETIRKLYHGVFPLFWDTLLYEKLPSENFSVFEKVHRRWRQRLSGRSAHNH